MKISIIKKFKQESRDYGVPIWRLPDFLIILMAVFNIAGMIATYYLISTFFVDDPRVAVLFVAVEAVVVLVIGNIIAESSRKIIVNYKLKEEFIDLISHQIRTPITNVKWNLELLNKEKLGLKQERYVKRLTESVEKITSLVSDFVYLSRLEQSKKELMLRKIDINKVVEEILKDFKIFADSKNVKLKFDNKCKKCFAKTDQKKIKIVLSNIVENALKYSYDESEVRVSVYKKKSNLIVKISDQGCGIDEQSKPFIFDKFYRAIDAKKLSTDGTGVGLYISKILLKEMDGDVWFESEVDKGSIFYMKIPSWN